MSEPTCPSCGLVFEDCDCPQVDIINAASGELAAMTCERDTWKQHYQTILDTRIGQVEHALKMRTDADKAVAELAALAKRLELSEIRSEKRRVEADKLSAESGGLYARIEALKAEVAELTERELATRATTVRAFQDLADIVGPREAGYADVWSSVELLVKERGAARAQAGGAGQVLEDAYQWMCWAKVHCGLRLLERFDKIAPEISKALADCGKAAPK